MMEKLFFESIAGLFYKHVFTALKETYRKTTQLGVTFTAGYLAGVLCPSSRTPQTRSFVSLVCQSVNRGDRKRDRHRCAGTGHTRGNDWHADGLQEWIYDSFKTAMGLGTTGGKCRRRRRRQPRGLGWWVGYCLS